MTVNNRHPELFRAFETLGIAPTFDVDTIREAFHQLALINHPDKHNSDASKRTAHDRFIAISHAKDFVLETIKDPAVVEEYDLVPLTIGYELSNGLLQPVIRVGTIIPCWSIQDIKIASNTDGEYLMKLYQGVRPLARENPVLCTCKFNSVLSPVDQHVLLPTRMRFEIDEQGILRISAFSAETDAELGIVLIGSDGLSQNEVDAHREQAQLKREEDKSRVNGIRSKK